MRTNHHSATNQRGAVMIVTLVLLVVLGVMALTSMRTSKLELRMAGNEEIRANAHQIAQALSDAIIATPTMTPVIGDIGFVLCTPGQPNCGLTSLFMPAGPLAPEVDAGHLSATAQLTAIGPPPPFTNSSADAFLANTYQVTTTYDRTDEGLGRAAITQGLVVLTLTTN